MIDFTLTENDKAQLARTRAEALICRKYAREYEEREELPPEELPERKEFLANAEPVPEAGPDDSPREHLADLKLKLQKAIADEAYELAAQIRDEIYALKKEEADAAN